MYVRMSAILLKAAQKHIGMKAVGKAGRCGMMKEINDKLKKEKKTVKTKASTSMHIRI